MKYNLLPLFLFSCICFNVICVFAQPSKSTYGEIIIGIPLINQKNFNDIKNRINEFDGVIVYGYCEQYHCFLLKYDLSKIKSDEILERKIITEFPKLKIEIKKGTAIFQLIDKCTNYFNSNESKEFELNFKSNQNEK